MLYFINATNAKYLPHAKIKSHISNLIKETLDYVPLGCLSEFVRSFRLLATKY